MKQSHLFTQTRKEVSQEEVAKNAQLLIRGGYIHKEMAGVYSLLPLGFKVLNKIKKIVNEEMEQLDSEEIIMSTIQVKETWEKTDRWSDEKVDVWFKSQLKNGTDIGFGWSHEEPITEMMKSHIKSYQNLPRYVHQFQNKLRNETRAKSGVMRCREFVMKDMYSYCTNEEEHMAFYNKTIDAYMNVYRRVGLGDITFVTSASGGVFTDKFSHEFQTICDAGEDVIYVHKDGKLAMNEEIFNEETLAKMGKKKEEFEAKKAAEVGNIFTFGTGKCEQLGLYFTDKDGVSKPVYLGSYGIGITRLMGVITEVFADDKGMVWPEAVAPFQMHLVSLCREDADIAKANEIYEKLKAKGVEVLYDDREGLRPGEKFADADLLGMPTRVVVSPKTIAAGVVEVTNRKTGETTMQPLESFLA